MFALFFNDSRSSVTERYITEYSNYEYEWHDLGIDSGHDYYIPANPDIRIARLVIEGTKYYAMGEGDQADGGTNSVLTAQDTNGVKTWTEYPNMPVLVDPAQERIDYMVYDDINDIRVFSSNKGYQYVDNSGVFTVGAFNVAYEIMFYSGEFLTIDQDNTPAPGVYIKTSSDGINWTLQGSADVVVGVPQRQFVIGPSMIVVLAADDELYYSTDSGANFTLCTYTGGVFTPDGATANSYTMKLIAGVHYFCIGGQYWSSTDGITWSLEAAANFSYYDIGWNGEKFVFGSAGKSIAGTGA